MKILVVGSGGREHALVWKLAQSAGAEKLYAAPGNPGMKGAAKLVPIAASDIGGIVSFCVSEKIGLAVIGPEAPLAAGMADRLRERGILCFGPGQEGARLESSKEYARSFMARHNIPIPAYRAFSAADALRHAEALDGPAVVKMDGLAQGKGVVVARDRIEAVAAVKEMMSAENSGGAKRAEKILIEECLTGEEVSLLTFTDGKTILPMLPVQDHKRIGEGDTGPNTGGMGAYAPVSVFTPETAARVHDEIVLPIQKGLLSDGIDYRGCLYIGLMLTPGGPKVIEFNARFGDPETQVLMPLLESDLLDIMLACASGGLGGRKLVWLKDSAVCVVMASRGYPGGYGAGHVIEEAPAAGDAARDSWVFHAGTQENADGKLTTSGGRVLGVTARGPSIEDALRRAYARVDAIHFEGRTFRRDIAYRELDRGK